MASAMEIAMKELGELIDLANANSNTIPGPVYNVTGKAYGATGDGTTDDTVAIQATIDAANTAGGGIVYFPSGKYLSTSLDLYSNVHLIGVDATIIGNFSTINTSLISGYGSISSDYTLTVNVAIGDVTVTVGDTTGLAVGDIIKVTDNRNGSKYANEYGIIKSLTATVITLHSPLSLPYTTANSAKVNKISGMENIIIDGLTIKCSDTASIDQLIDFRRANNITIKNVTVRNHRSSLNAVNANTIYFDTVFNATIENNKKFGVGDSSLDSGGFVNVLNCGDVTVTKNRAYNAYFGYVIFGSTHSRISKNVVRSNNQNASRGCKLAYSYYCWVSKNTIIGCDSPVKYEDSGRCIIEDNIIISQGYIGGGNAINCSSQYITDKPNANYVYTVIKGNVVNKADGNGIYLDETYQNSQVLNNTLNKIDERAIIVEGPATDISGNRINDCDFLGIDFNPLNAKVTNNYVNINGTGTTSYRMVAGTEANANTCMFSDNYGNIAISGSFAAMKVMANNNILSLKSTTTVIIPVYNKGLSSDTTTSSSYQQIWTTAFPGTSQYPSNATYTMVATGYVSGGTMEAYFETPAGTDGVVSISSGSVSIGTAVITNFPTAATIISLKFRSTGGVSSVYIKEAYIKVEW